MGSFEDLKEGDTVTFDEDLTGMKGPAAVNVQKAQQFQKLIKGPRKGAFDFAYMVSFLPS